MNAGCDQPRGESRPELIVQLVEQRRISEDRTDYSTSAASSGSSAELYFNSPFFGAPENHQFDHTVGCRLKRLE